MKSGALTALNTAAEKEIDRLVAAIETQRLRVEALTLTAAGLKSEVKVFEQHYTAHVSRYYQELDKVALETKEYRLRLQLRRENVDAEEIEARVESCFRSSRERIEVNAAESAQEKEEPETEKLPEAEAKTLQTLYRKLAKRYHPDKVRDAAVEARHEQLMPLINRAYQEQDFETLERLSLGETDVHIPADKQRALQTELGKLNRAGSQLQSEINRLKAGRSYQLKQEVEAAKRSGTDLLSELTRDLERKVQAGRSHLARLINMWHVVP